ncbi:MAG: hypothetical protein ACPGES_12350 [Coraliomargarita sp.]
MQLTAQPVYSQLEDGDQIDILLHSLGCFHNYHDRYLIQKADGVTEFSYYTADWSSENSEWNYEVVGTMKLNARQIQLLDSELRRYRETTPISTKEEVDGRWVVERSRLSSSTTSTTLAIKYIEAGRLLGTELLQNPEFLGMSPAGSALFTIKQMLVEAKEHRASQ